jgi:hypothetical protein
MNCNRILRLPLALLLISAAAWAQSHLSPPRLGFYRPELPAAVEAQLLMDRLRVAIEKRDAAMLADLFAMDYHEVQTAKSTTASLVISRDALLLAAALFSQGEEPALHFKWNTVAENNTELQINFEAGRRPVAGQSTQRREVFVTMARFGQRWKIIESSGLYDFIAQTSPEDQMFASSASVTENDYLLLDRVPAKQNSIIRRPLAENLGIDRLTRTVTQQKLGKKLFSLPSDAALYARVEQFNSPPYFSGTYVQLVTDPAWNRIVYGDYQQSIKAYDGGLTEGKLNRPMGIDRDSRGYVYVADTGNNRVLVLQLTGGVGDLTLRYFTSLGEGELSLPYDVAWDDRGTPFDTVDDMIWIAEQGNRRVSGYRLQLSGVQKIVEYGDGEKPFEKLIAVAVGRFNGASSGEIYASDAGRNQVVRLYFDGAALQEVGRYQGKAEAQFEAVATDHWGNVFVTDRSLREIIKLNNRLEELAVLPAELENDLTPLRFEPAFAGISLAQTGEALWSGYNQGFVLEKWTENSGAQRLELGIDVAKLQVKLSESLEDVSITSRLTDAGELSIEILDAAGRTIHAFQESWQLAGEQQVAWNRRDGNGRWVAPGYYRVGFSATSTYGTRLAKTETPDFFLPLYYHEDCGGDVEKDSHLAQGLRSRKFGELPEQTVVTDEQRVVYRFNDLNPALQYEVRAEFFSGEGTVAQRLLVDDREVLAAQNVDANLMRTEWLKLPAETFADGAVDVVVEKIGGMALASISQLWIRQASFDPNNPPAREVNTALLPREFELKQNYPNPFNPETTIEFAVPEGFSETVELSIFNVLGQRVRTLVNGYMPAGRYAKIWNATSDGGQKVASGVYFYRFSAGAFTQTRKLLLMK